MNLALIVCVVFFRALLPTAVGDHAPQDASGGQDKIQVAGKVVSQSNIALRNQTGISLAIIHIVPEGTVVKPGDLVVALDDAQLQKDLAEQSIAMLHAKSDLVTAESELASLEAEFEAQVKLAKLELDLANKHEQRQLSQLELEITKANSELDVAKQTRDLVAQRLQALKQSGNPTAEQEQEFKLEIAAADSAVTIAEAHLKFLQGPERETRVAEARRTKLAAETEMIQIENNFRLQTSQAHAKLEMAREALKLQQEKQDKIQQQIKYCRIIAPQKGRVSFAQVHNRDGGSAIRVKPGTIIRHRQTIARLPDMDQLHVAVMIPESQVTRVRQGQAAVITIDAFPDQSFAGKVGEIKTYAAPGSWQRRDDVRHYPVTIVLEEKPVGLQLGMTASVKIDTTER